MNFFSIHAVRNLYESVVGESRFPRRFSRGSTTTAAPVHTIMRWIVRQIARIFRLFDRLQNALDRENGSLLETTIPPVSEWSVGEQIDHSLQVANRISAIVLKQQPADGMGISMKGRFVLVTGFIPRGKAKAPDSVLPKKRERQELQDAIDRARGQLEALSSDKTLLASNAKCFQHPFLGSFTAAQSLRFIEVHTRHHLKIIDEIMAAARYKQV